jgi:hypothetical protein
MRAWSILILSGVLHFFNWQLPNFNLMEILNKFRIISFVVLLPFISNAQVLLKPENVVLNKELVKTSHHFHKVIVFDSLGNKQEELMNESIIKIDSLNGRIIFSRFRQSPYGTHHLDTSIAQLSNMSPLNLSSSNNPLKKSLVIKFDENNVKVHAFIKGRFNDTVFNMENGYYDDNTIEHYIGYFKLLKGVKYKVNTFRYESNGNNPYEFEYLFDDLLVAQNNNLIKCAVIKYSNKYVNGYIWYEIATGQMLKELGFTKNGSFVVIAS